MDVSRWNQNFEEIRRYLEEHNCTLADIPKSVRADSTGTVMKIWIMEMRKAYRDCASSNFHLNDEQKEKLRSIGMEELVNQPEHEWLAHLMDVKQFYEEHHTFSVPDGTKSRNLNLHTWMVKQRADFRNGTMSAERLQKIQELNMMEMLSTRDVPFQNGYQHAKEFYEKNHHLLVPENFMCEDGYPLGEWLCAVKYEFSGNRLSPTRIRKLNRIGMVWNAEVYEFDEGYQHALLFHQENHHLLVPENFRCEDGYELGKWIHRTKEQFSDKRLTFAQTEKLKQIGMPRNEKEYQFETGFRYAERFYKEHHHLLTDTDFVCADNFHLGAWISEIRYQFAENLLSAEQIRKLESIGMVWSIRTQNFDVGYLHAKLFYEEHGHLLVYPAFQCGNGYPLGLWISSQRYKFEKNQLSQDEVEKLNQIGMIWDTLMRAKAARATGEKTSNG